METVQDIAWITLLLSGVVLVVVVITVLLRLRNSIDVLLQEIQRFGQRTEPILDKLEAVATKTEEALTMITENREALRQATDNLRTVTANIRRLETTLQEQIEPVVVGVASRLAGIRNGIAAFLDTLRKRR